MWWTYRHNVVMFGTRDLELHKKIGDFFRTLKIPIKLDNGANRKKQYDVYETIIPLDDFKHYKNDILESKLLKPILRTYPYRLDWEEKQKIERENIRLENKKKMNDYFINNPEMQKFIK